MEHHGHLDHEKLLGAPVAVVHGDVGEGPPHALEAAHHVRRHDQAAPEAVADAPGRVGEQQVGREGRLQRDERSRSG